MYNFILISNMLDDAGKNKNVANAPVLYARKVEEEEEVFTLPKVNLSFRLRLQKARQEKQISQKDLAVVSCFRITVNCRN